MTIRSMPSPKAKPVYVVRVVADARSTFGWTMPAPPISSQPVLLADPAALAVADRAVDREIDARLDEREEVAAEADPPLRAEELPRQLGKDALEVGHRDVLVDGQPFELVEHPLVRGVLRLVAVDAAGHDHAHRRLRSAP